MKGLWSGFVVDDEAKALRSGELAVASSRIERDGEVIDRALALRGVVTEVCGLAGWVCP